MNEKCVLVTEEPRFTEGARQWQVFGVRRGQLRVRNILCAMEVVRQTEIALRGSIRSWWGPSQSSAVSLNGVSNGMLRPARCCVAVKGYSLQFRAEQHFHIDLRWDHPESLLLHSWMAPSIPADVCWLGCLCWRYNGNWIRMAVCAFITWLDNQKGCCLTRELGLNPEWSFLLMEFIYQVSFHSLKKCMLVIVSSKLFAFMWVCLIFDIISCFFLGGCCTVV